MNEIMSRVRPEEWERRIIFMPSEVRLKIFLKKYIIRALQINCLAGQEGFFTKKCQEVHRR